MRKVASGRRERGSSGSSFTPCQGSFPVPRLRSKSSALNLHNRNIPREVDMPRISRLRRPTKDDTGPGRRGLLKRIGATGLASSAAVFFSTATAKSASASAQYDDQCCDLAHAPSSDPDYRFDICVQEYDYLWTCSISGTLHCSCC